ncbi:unnamed protein product [Dovyalis caffra]|uniref:Phosphoinositide phospholipase C n=1 Tax=Dovyalis caffra TaxID=77055 RepID=A0AAV1RB17_9ROSI|nr:unnamed protein product [Dovyalis caffra]
MHRLLEPPEDVKKLFQNYSQNGTMSIDGLRKFLSEVQGQNNATEDDAQAIFDSLKHLNIFQRKELDLDAFFRYLLGDLNTPLSPSSSVQHDMTAPLAHYFMYTGHNSYLTGNQLSSESSVEPIKKALLKGVRVIELDLWRGQNNNVVVRHGRTLTGSVELLKCLLAIKEFAFQASEYPVVITFEDHLLADLQAKVAEVTMVAKTFGGMLYRPGTDPLLKFPSPESLKKKVLISTKPPKKYLETQDGKPSQKSTKSSKKGQEDDDEDEIAEGEHLQEEYEEMKVPEYRHLIAIHAMKPKGALGNWFSTDEKEVRRLSLSEQKLEKATSTRGIDIIRFTQRNLLRIYPKGTRITSSNYDPFVGWTHGAQMVAFNMQGYGKHLWIMQGMFRANGGCGYVKKPDFLLSEQVFDPSMQLPVKKILKVKIYSGVGWHLDFPNTHFDPYSPPDFFFKNATLDFPLLEQDHVKNVTYDNQLMDSQVAIAGVQADKAEDKTNVVNNSWLPEWNEEFKFKLTVPELAVLRIKVVEQDISGNNDFGGQTCLPISELRTGIRAVPLHNRRGEKYKNTELLIKFDLLDPEECSD